MEEGYQIILADPPWSWSSWSVKGEGRSARNHYDVMDNPDIANLPVSNIIAENSALFLWCIMPMLPSALYVMQKWGFTYKTCAFTWIKMTKNNKKPAMGMGYYTRSSTELCLLGTHGKPLPRASKSVRQVVMSPRGEHSCKPPVVRDRIVELFGDIKRIELFAREPIPDGWEKWGDAVENSIEFE